MFRLRAGEEATEERAKNSGQGEAQLKLLPAAYRNGTDGTYFVNAQQTLSRSEIIQYGRTLPAAPRIISHLREMLTDVNTEVGDIARTIRTDPALVVRVVRMSKASAFGGAGDVADIEEALARVGFGNVLGVVGAAGLTQLAPSPLRLYGITVDAFQACSLCHALAAENLADLFGGDPQAAYIASLLRGIGMIVLDHAAGEVVSEGVSFSVMPEDSYANFERRLFGVTSVDATRILMDEWKFPSDVVTAIDLHHLAEPHCLENRLACIVNVAGEIAAAVGHGLPGDSVHWLAAPEKYDVLGLSREQWDRICADVHGAFIGACEAIKAS